MHFYKKPLSKTEAFFLPGWQSLKNLILFSTLPPSVNQSEFEIELLISY